MAAALVAVLVVAGAVRAGPIWFAKTQTDESYFQCAFAGAIVGDDLASYDYYFTPWATPVSFWETRSGENDRLLIDGWSEHVVAVHPNETTPGRWAYTLHVIGPPGGASAVSRAVLTPHPRHPGTRHLDIHRAVLGVGGDGTGEITGYAYACIGRHTPRPDTLYAAVLASTTSARIYYGDTTIILDESDHSMVMGVVLGNADFVELNGAAIRRTEDDAMILDLRGEGHWQDAGGIGIAADIGLDSTVTFPSEYLPDLISGNAYVEILVGGDVIRGELTEVHPEWLVIPEPATCALLAAALTGLAGYLKRRRGRTRQSEGADR